MSLNRFQGNLTAAITGASQIQYASSYTIYVCPVGGRVATASSSNVITLDRGHSFRPQDSNPLRAGDKFLLNPGTDNLFSGEGVQSVDDVNNTITFPSATFNLGVGDVLVNLGPDSGTTSPNYDAIPMGITDQPDGGGIFATPSVNSDPQGNFEFYHRGDGKFWLLIIDSAGVVAGLQQGVSGMSRNNVADYGARCDGTTDDADRIRGAILALPDNGGECFLPGTDIGLASPVKVDRGEFSYVGNGHSRLRILTPTVTSGGIFSLNVNGNNHAAGRVSNVHVRGIKFYDDDPLNHVAGEESHGVRFGFVDNCSVRDCHFEAMGDESIDAAQCTDAKIVNNHFKGCTAASLGPGGTVSLNNTDTSLVEGNTFEDNDSGQCIRVEVTLAGQSVSHCIIRGNIIDTPQDVRALGGNDDGVGIAVYPGSDVTNDIIISENIIKSPLRAGIAVNPTGSGSLDRIVVSGNIVSGGGTGPWSALSVNGAITFKGIANNGIIKGNIVNNWGGSNTESEFGIYVRRHRVVVANNLIGNMQKGIRSDGDDTGEGNLISGNRIHTLTGSAIVAQGRDLVVGNSIDSIVVSSATQYGIYTDDDSAGNEAKVLAVANIVRNMTLSGGGTSGTGIRVYKKSVAALNIISNCTLGLVLNDGGDATSSPTSFANVFDGNTSQWNDQAAAGGGHLIAPFGDGESTEFKTDASGSETITNPATSADVIHGCKDVDIADIHITPQGTGWDSVTAFGISIVDAQTFRINCVGGPASSLTFSWHIIKRFKI